MPILSIDHVQIAIPVAAEDRARAFYSDILGFIEIEKPSQMAERRSIWFIAGAVNLHLGIEPDFHPARRAHPAFVVEGLDAILAALHAPVSWPSPTLPSTASAASTSSIPSEIVSNSWNV
jgi:catechol 2,3-dioxygenase-like lactoylglutathione lyase family enzyme